MHFSPDCQHETENPDKILGLGILLHTRNVKIPEMERTVALLQKI
jgi:hypothetical protein